MLRIVRFIFVILASSALPASAASMRQWSIGSWQLGAYTNDTSGAFSHCAASAIYKSGISVFFSINKDFGWSMGFANRSWRLRRGATYDIAFTVDDMDPISAKAFVISSDLIRVELADSVELFSRFRRGHVLKVAGASEVFSFNLTNTAQLLPSLLTCAQNKGAVVIASNPFDKTPSSPARSAPDDSASRAEATAFAANLLSSAGVQGFRLLTPTELPELRGHARWVEGSTFGSVDILSLKKNEFKELPSYFIGADAKACKGAFLSGAIPDDSSKGLTRVFTSCQADTKTITVYYLAVPRKAGGAYVISTASFGSEKPAKERDTLLQSAVFKALGDGLSN